MQCNKYSMMCFEMSTVLYMMITWQSAFVINVELRISNVETVIKTVHRKEKEQ